MLKAIAIFDAADNTVTSLNGLIGALTLTSANGTIVITPSGATIDLSVVKTALIVTTVSTTTYTLQASDNGTVIRFTNAAGCAVTCPNNFSAGYNVGLLQIGAGFVTPSAASGATLVNAHSFTKTYGQNAAASLIVDNNSGGTSAHWILGGDCA